MYDQTTIEFARAQEALVLPLEYRVHTQADGRSESREECMRDYARVLYSSSFRRLQGKMQLLGVDANRFNRNRLTHSLEVAQIARSIAADLGLERSVVSETCSLAHDIGNPPFGHYGEKILDELAADAGGFEGNAQAFRTLRTLEKKHHAYAGLNLTVRSLLGITKYFQRRADNPKKFLYDEDYEFLSGQLAARGVSLRKSIDAQIMDLADEIAYAAHDVEDALSFGIITWGEIVHEFKISKDFSGAYQQFSAIANHAHAVALDCDMQESSEEYSIVLRKELTSQIVHELCRDIAVIEGMHGPELGYRTKGLLARGLKSLLWRAILRKKDVQLYEKRGEKIIRGLFEVLTDKSYNKGGILLPPAIRSLKDSRERLVVDYISGMMDSYAAKEYEKYFGPGSLDRIYPRRMNDSRHEYERRMNRVLDHIDRNLDAQLDLPVLADVANFSRFHFHRIFAAWMGETIGDYVRRRRLEVAAGKLAAGGAVLDVALATGFGSGEAFARAFKTRFGSTPTEWRSNTPERTAAFLAGLRAQHSNFDQVNGKPGQAGAGGTGEHGDSHNPYGENTMDVKVIDMPPARVAYRRHIGPYGPAIGEFWGRTMMPWLLGHGLADATCYGIGHDDPSVTPADKCRYDACVEIPSGFEPGGQFSVANLPGGRYAVTRYTGSPRDIGPVWNRLMKEWLPSSGLQCDERPCFERYEGLATQDDGSFTCDICIPVRAL